MAASVVMILAYYQWGNWRKAHMLPASSGPASAATPPDEDVQSATPVNSDALLEQSPACDRVAIPAEVAGLPPGPVANQAKTVDS